MEWMAFIAQLLTGFVVGTLVLWLCSLTVNTPNGNLKTAATYHAVMLVPSLALLGIAWVFVATESSGAGLVLGVSALATVVLSYLLLMHLYAISFFATLWLVLAMWVVRAGVDKLTSALF